MTWRGAARLNKDNSRAPDQDFRGRGRCSRTTLVSTTQKMNANSAGVPVPPGGNQAQTKFAAPIASPAQASHGGRALERIATTAAGSMNIAIAAQSNGVSALDRSK